MNVEPTKRNSEPVTSVRLAGQPLETTEREVSVKKIVKSQSLLYRTHEERTSYVNSV
jgi:hypothetical protein